MRNDEKSVCKKPCRTELFCSCLFPMVRTMKKNDQEFIISTVFLAGIVVMSSKTMADPAIEPRRIHDLLP